MTWDSDNLDLFDMKRNCNMLALSIPAHVNLPKLESTTDLRGYVLTAGLYIADNPHGTHSVPFLYTLLDFRSNFVLLCSCLFL